jgi:hypothetical protein
MPKHQNIETGQGAMPELAADTTTVSDERERIAARAYELYLARGGADGQAEEDWLEAERELLIGSQPLDES